jgi:hypothetical protein
MSAPQPAKEQSQDVHAWDVIGYPMYKQFKKTGKLHEGHYYFYTHMNQDQQRCCLQDFAQAFREGKLRKFWAELDKQAENGSESQRARSRSPRQQHGIDSKQ